MSMQEEALQAQLPEPLVRHLIAVFVVASQRMACMLSVYTYLVSAPGDRTGFDQRGVSEGLDNGEAREGGLAVQGHPHHTLAGAERVLFKRRVDRRAPFRPTAGHQRQIALVDTLAAQSFMQYQQRTALLRHHDAARGVAIEPVHQLEKASLRTQCAQRFDQPQADAAATVHREPGRLVDDDQTLVFVEDGIRQAVGKARGNRHLGTFLLAHPQRRYAHLVATLQPVFSLHTPFVDPHLALAQQAVNACLGHTLELTQQEVIDSLAVTVGVDVDQTNARGTALIAHVRLVSECNYLNGLVIADILPGRRDY